MFKAHTKFIIPVLILLFVSPGFSGTQGDQSAHFNSNIYKKPELVLVKGGEFMMGLKQDQEITKTDKPVYVDNPAHKVYVDSFYIDKYEVTNYQYYCFCLATGRNLPELWGMNGLHDMAGNVAEWTADLYDKDYYLNSSAKNPRGPEVGKHRVIRGGGWHTGPGCMRVAYRNCLKSGWVDFNMGFRCVRDVK